MSAETSPPTSAGGLLWPGLCLLALVGLTAGAIAAGWDDPVARLAKPLGQAGFGQAWAKAAYWLGLGGIQMALMALLGLIGYLWRRRGLSLQPGLDRSVLSVEMGQIGHQILDHRQVGQGIDLDIAVDLFDRLETGQGIGAIDVHGA